MADIVAARVLIRGCVQGVWFRAWTENVARDLCLDGWVRNRTDGSVEAFFMGPLPVIEQVIENCHKEPPVARVDEVAHALEDARPLLGHGFAIRPTA